MRQLHGGKGRALHGAVLVCLFACAATITAQQSLGTLRGRVTDELGGVIVGATVTATDAAGVERSAVTDDEGRYVFSALAPGRYTVRINQPGFAAYENLGVEITAGRTDPLDIVLTVSIEQEEVTVIAEEGVGTDPESNAGAVVLRGEDLDALPDDPDDLSEALQALAGPSVGAEGGADIYLDGFSGGRLPPKESIREIRINRNPFSAEYDRLGYGRVEIFTKPGTDRFRGQAFFNFNDESLNSRAPFAPTRAPYQSRRYGGNISGPISAGRASFFLDFERRETDDNEVVQAVVLDEDDPLLPAVPFSQTLLTPDRRTTFSPRLDYQISPTNTLVARYSFERTSREGEGVGGFNLPERAYDVESREHTLRLTETAVINQKVINETRFQYSRDSRQNEGGSFAPTLRVLDAFTAGGAQSGQSSNELDRVELQNYTSWAWGDHALKVGARLRSAGVRDISRQNFAGTFTFTTLEQYRASLQGTARPTQFSVAGGQPEVSVRQTDFSPFIQDDWRVRPNLTLSAGLGYEAQANIDSALNFAPRLAFAWSPAAGGGGGGGARGQQTVIRGGFGVFFDRFGENLLLQSERFNGTTQQQFLITEPPPEDTSGRAELARQLLARFPDVPTVEELTAFRIPQTVRQLAPDLRTPYTMQTAISLERQLARNVTLSVSLIGARSLHVLRSRNVNAPLTDGDGRPLRDSSGQLIRPNPLGGNLFQYESSGRFSQRQLIVNFNNRFSRSYSFSVNYTLNRARGDAEGAGTFPVNQYDLTGEYGRSLQDIRHRFFFFGTISSLPWGLRLNPIVVVNSGRPFNITLGRDLNADSLFTERPAFADSQTSAADLRRTLWGDFDINPKPGQAIIPRNYGTGPAFFSVNLRASKTFGFGEVADARAGGQGGGRRGGGGGGGGRRGGGLGGGMQGGGGGGETTERRYNLTVSVNVQNLFNRSNLGVPVGNLSSQLFGQPVTTAGRFGAGGGGGGNPQAGNRRVELQLRFNF